MRYLHLFAGIILLLLPSPTLAADIFSTPPPAILMNSGGNLSRF